MSSVNFAVAPVVIKHSLIILPLSVMLEFDSGPSDGEAGNYDLVVVFSLGTKPDLCASQVEWEVYEEYCL